MHLNAIKMPRHIFLRAYMYFKVEVFWEGHKHLTLLSSIKKQNIWTLIRCQKKPKFIEQKQKISRNSQKYLYLIPRFWYKLKNRVSKKCLTWELQKSSKILKILTINKWRQNGKSVLLINIPNAQNFS